MKKWLISMFMINLLLISRVFSAVGCSLNDPDREVRRIFKNATGYKTEYITIKEKKNEFLKSRIEEKLKDKFDPIYESIDVPYTYYTVLVGTVPIGRIHGINQKGVYGGMQIILSTDLNGKVMDFFYQKISSPGSSKFRSNKFTSQFRGITLLDFLKFDEGTPNKLSKIKDPRLKGDKDFKLTLRGIKKNLILLDEFMLKNKYYNLYIKNLIKKREKIKNGKKD